MRRSSLGRCRFGGEHSVPIEVPTFDLNSRAFYNREAFTQSADRFPRSHVLRDLRSVRADIVFFEVIDHDNAHREFLSDDELLANGDRLLIYKRPPALELLEDGLRGRPVPGRAVVCIIQENFGSLADGRSANGLQVAKHMSENRRGHRRGWGFGDRRADLLRGTRN